MITPNTTRVGGTSSTYSGGIRTIGINDQRVNEPMINELTGGKNETSDQRY